MACASSGRGFFIAMRKLTRKQRLFVEEYLVDFNATQAAIRSGYAKPSAGQIGHALLRKTHIATLIESKMQDRTEKLDISQDRILLEMARIALFDPRTMFDIDGNLKDISDLSSNTAAVISSFDVSSMETEEGQTVTVSKIRLCDKTKNLGELGKHLGLFKEDNDQRRGEYSSLSDEELDAKLANARKKAKAEQKK